MNATVSTSENQEYLVYGLVAEEVKACLQAGREPDVEALIRDHPDLASQIRQLVPTLILVHQLGENKEAAPQPGTNRVGNGDVPEQLGDFRILREIGRGGMGVVYEAQQISLKRRVALKVLPFAAVLDPRQLQRFQNEAQTAACLHHTNIVPVHAVGSERGVHFYAMQYIDGLSLAQVIEDLRLRILPKSAESRALQPGQPATQAWQAGPPVPQSPIGNRQPASTPTPPVAALSTQRSISSRDFFQSVARLGIEAAEGLDHAHQQGILHRDIKPANLLLDVRGNLWITDFGLARFQSETRLSMTGDLIGTLRYMSPEQALAKRVVVDHRTDIYSLGVTLYELLTLEPAYSGSDRQELLRQIAFEEPRSLRRLNKSIPAALEMIVLKAMEKNPAERYATAQELADDLRRFLEDKPIRARRPTLRERARKWARRHHGLVAAIMVVLALTAAVSSVSSLFIWQAQQRTAKALTEARDQRQRAESNFALARQAVDDMYTEVAEKWLAEQPRMTEVQRQFLQKALQFYQGFAQEPGTEPAVQANTAAAYKRVEDIQAKLGANSEAETAYRAALQILESLATDFPTVPQYRYGLGRITNNLGIVLGATGRRAEAETAYRAARKLQEQLAADFPTVPQYRADLAYSHNNLGLLLGDTSRAQDAEGACRAALKLQEQLAADFPTKPEYRADLARSRHNLRIVLSNTGRRAEAEAEGRAAHQIQEQLVADFPTVPQYRQQLAESHNCLGVSLVLLGRRAEAETAFRAALKLREQLVADFPTVLDYAVDLGITYATLAKLKLEQTKGESAAGFELSAKAIHTLSAVLAKDKHVMKARKYLIAVHRDRIWALLQLRQYAEALPYFDRAIELAEGSERDYFRVHRASDLVRSGQTAQAVAEADSLTQDKNIPGSTLYDVACIYALASTALKDNSQQAENHALKAIALLSRAQMAGFFQEPAKIAHLKEDTDFDTFRARADYQRLIQELEKKTRQKGK